MELRLLFRLIRRWAWLLVLGLVLGAGASYLASSYQTPVYQSSTLLMVFQGPKSGVSDLADLSDQELIRTYIELLTTQPVLEETSRVLSFSVGRGQLSGRQKPGTRLMEVTVRDNDPERAALIANTVVEVLIQQNEELQASRFSASESSYQAQIAQIQEQMALLQENEAERSEEVLESVRQQLEEEEQRLEEEIYSLQRQVSDVELEIEELSPVTLPGEEPPQLSAAEREALSQKRTELAQLQFNLDLAKRNYLAVTQRQAESDAQANGTREERTDQQQATLALYQQIYSTLLSNYESVRLARLQNTPNVIQVEPATAINQPVEPNIPTNVALGAAVGLIIMGGIVVVIEYLDDTLKTPEDISRTADLPVIGYIEEEKSLENGRPLLVKMHFGSPTAEAFRTLRTNLELATTKQPPIAILITSAGIEDGKTTVALNLATMYGQAGYQTILLDADLRRPSIHRKLNLSNKKGGLSNLAWDQLEVEDVIQEARKVDNVRVISSGDLPPNPTELLRSDEMGRVLDELKEIADVVIIDSPPMVVSDAVMLSTKVDAVILVLKPGQVTVGGFRAVVEQLNRADAPIAGVVLNRIPKRLVHYYQAYRSRYYGHLDGKAASGNKKSSGKGFLRQVFGRS